MNKHILVTGTSRGIGAAIAEALAPDALVAGHGSSAGDGRIGADLAQPGAAAALWAAALERLGGRVDVLVNNAGLFEAAPIDLPDAAWAESWERTQRINLQSAAELCRLAVRHWQAQGTAGRIVNVASRAAYRGDSPDHWHYAAAKAGMVAMTKTIARAYAADGILAFAVCPGFVATRMAVDYLADGGPARDIPLGRVAEAGEVATAVRFLALAAPPSMTGAAIDINGASFVR